MRNRSWWALVWLALPAMAAEHKFDFGEVLPGQTPPGFHSTLMGKGSPGDWKIILDDVPPALAPLTAEAPAVTKQAVLAQMAQDPTDEHFPMLIYEGETFGDFKLTTRFKTVKGVMEQMAGIAFRVQNETNYYVARASSLGNTFKFYKVLNGERGPLVGPDTPIREGVWHSLEIECQANSIRCLLDGKEVVNVTDKANALTSGKVGFWTKSDSVSYFTDTRIVYKPFLPPAQKLVRDLLSRYPRLLGVKVYVPGKDAQSTRLVASGNEKEIGQAGGKTEHEVISRAETYYGKEKEVVSVIMPLRDRNGDAIAAVRVAMKSFKGQTEENAIIRAVPIVKDLQAQIQSLDDLVE
jgi:hypothetical protein